MFFGIEKVRPLAYSIILVLSLLILSSTGTAGTTALVAAPSANPPALTPVQYYPNHYPPGYYPPTPDNYQGTKGAKGSGWIFIEVEPSEAAVYIDGHKLDPREDNTYEEGVLAGRHKVEAKKGGYRDYMRFIDVYPGAKENLNINLRRIE